MSGSIEWLHREIADCMLCALVLDVCPVHRTEWAIVAAKENNVELRFVPGGGTGRFQPIDGRIFGELKARAQADFSRRLWREGSETMNHSISVNILEKCWVRSGRPCSEGVECSLTKHWLQYSADEVLESERGVRI
jgi:hypothetical protein